MSAATQRPRSREPLRDPRLNGALYALAAAGTLAGNAYDLHLLTFLCKPVLLIVLSSWFYFSSRRYGDRLTLLVQAGLFFSLIGDVFLMLDHLDEFNFLIGLSAFLIAHICYAMAFFQNAVDMGGPQGLFVSVLIAVLLIAYAFFFSYDLVPYLDEALAIPVVAYTVAITLMGIGAGFRWRRTFPRSFWMVFAGALLFIASDSLLAHSRFVRPFAMDGTLVLLTYIVAQFLIAAGCLLHVLDPEEIRRRQALRT